MRQSEKNWVIIRNHHLFTFGKTTAFFFFFFNWKSKMQEAWARHPTLLGTESHICARGPAFTQPEEKETT